MNWFVIDTETYVVDCSGSYAKCKNYMADRFLCNPKTAVLMCDPVEFLNKNYYDIINRQIPLEDYKKELEGEK